MTGPMIGFMIDDAYQDQRYVQQVRTWKLNVFLELVYRVREVAWDHQIPNSKP